MAEQGFLSVKEIEKLHKWFRGNQRSFPWREDRTPYRIWISEVMLQQTRASVVVPYFLRWMEFFPDVKTLAEASIEQVIKAWEGLGYYSRARNLHAAARQITEQFGGVIPDSAEALAAIRGFGPYTIGALLSFGFQKRAAAVDGNVIRVLARYFLIEENISKQSTRRNIERLAEASLDQKEPWITAEAWIELGASICLPKPRCEHCPLKDGCLALQAKKADVLPIKNETVQTLALYRFVAVVENNGLFLIRKGKKEKVMADLYEFPYFEVAQGFCSKRKAVEIVGKFLKGKVTFLRLLSERRHAFTRYKAHLYPFWFRAENGVPLSGFEWVSVGRFSFLPFSSGHRKIADEIAGLTH